MSTSRITTHVLDATTGRPAIGVAVELSARTGDGWSSIAVGATDADGRISTLGPGELAPGEYRLRFDTGAYFAANDTPAFYPEALLTFRVDEQHCHVPLLLSPFAYSTYRGS